MTWLGGSLSSVMTTKRGVSKRLRGATAAEAEVLSQLVELGLNRGRRPAYAGFFRDSSIPQMGQRSLSSSNSRPQP